MNNALEYVTNKDFAIFCLPGNMELPDSWNSIGRIGRSGNNFEDVWNDVSTPGGLYFVPYADGTMDCATMETAREDLKRQVDYWKDKLLAGGLNDEEIYYSGQIINYLNNKLVNYSDVMIRSCTTPGTGTQGPATTIPGSDSGVVLPDPGTDTSADGATDTSKPNYLLYGLGLAAVILWPKKSSNRKKRVSGIGQNGLLLLGLGALLVFSGKKLSPIYTTVYSDEFAGEGWPDDQTTAR